MAGPADTYKADLTSNVSNFERLASNPAALGKTVEEAVQIGRIVYEGLQGTTPWTDTNQGLFSWGASFDSWANLNRRLAEARAIVINQSRGWEPPPPPQEVPGVLEGTADELTNPEGIERLKQLLEQLGTGAKVAVGAVVVLVVAAVFFRVRG